MEKKNETKAISLAVTEGLTVTVLPELNHEFLMSTKEVAAGFGTSDYVIRRSKLDHSHELIEGKHFVTAVSFSHSELKGALKALNIPHNAVLWTKRGIVRLGFFIKSERAKLFRDWAEELVIDALAIPSTRFAAQGTLPARRTRANRLTSDRLLSIMADVTRIDDRELRLSIANKLMMGGLA